RAHPLQNTGTQIAAGNLSDAGSTPMLNPSATLTRPVDRVRAGFASGIERGRSIVPPAEGFEQEPARSVGSLLVVGDSTALGAGAEKPHQSVAGRLGRRFPGLRIRNVAVDGARLA